MTDEEIKKLKDEVYTWKEASSTNSYKAFQLQEENKTLSMHILELQNDKDELTDRCRELEEQIEKNKFIGRTSYIKGIRTMANALKTYDRVNGAWTDYFEHTVDKVLKELLKEIKENE